jgi:hypothetical protein
MTDTSHTEKISNTLAVEASLVKWKFHTSENASSEDDALVSQGIVQIVESHSPKLIINIH